MAALQVSCWCVSVVVGESRLLAWVYSLRLSYDTDTQYDGRDRQGEEFKTGKMEYEKTDGSRCTQTHTQTVGWLGKISNQHQEDREKHRGLFQKFIDIHIKATHTGASTHNVSTTVEKILINVSIIFKSFYRLESEPPRSLYKTSSYFQALQNNSWRKMIA